MIQVQEKLNTSFAEKPEESLKLIPKNIYRDVLRKYIPEECFIIDIKHSLSYMFFMAFYLGGFFLILNVQSTPVKLVISALMGITLGSLTFVLHDLAHGSVINSRLGSYLASLSIGLFNLFSPSFWKKVHNFHHARTGSTDDPDRSYISSEKPKNPVERFVYRTRISDEAFHPMISLILMSTGFFWYFLNTMTNGLVGKNLNLYEKGNGKYDRLQALFKKPIDKAIVLVELFIILAFQGFLLSFVCKGNFLNYFLLSLMPITIAHFIAMSYIHTNHFLSPLTGEVDDPLINSLSIKNSWFVDKVFSNFSHHVEHHLFPAMSSSHYPKVRKLLLDLYPAKFKLIPMIDAMKMLFKTPRIYSNYTTLASLDGKKKVNCLLPGV